MTLNPQSIAVTSRAFSQNPILREEILRRFHRVKFNDTGRQLLESELLDFIKGSDAAIVSLEKIDHSLLEKSPDLKVISKYGVGLDNVDFEALQKNNLKFSWVGGVNRRSVAELALSFMLLTLRKSYEANQSLLKGTWKPLFGSQLTGKTVGIIGCGFIGKDLVQLLKPFECKIRVYDIVRYDDFYRENNIEAMGLEDLLKISDVVTLHLPLNKMTRGFMNKEKLDLLKVGAVLINTARGGLVDEVALKEKLEARNLSAAFDVFADEPARDLNLLNLPNFFSTPHMGGSSEEAVLAMGRAAIEGLSKAMPIQEWLEQNQGVI